MALPWGSSWGTSWGNAWGQATAPVAHWGQSWGVSWSDAWGPQNEIPVEPPVEQTPVQFQPIASGGGRGTTAVYDQDWSRYGKAERKRRAKIEREAEREPEPPKPVPPLHPRTLEELARVALRDPKPVMVPAPELPLPVFRAPEPDDDIDDDELMMILGLAA